MSENSFLYLTDTQERDYTGCNILRLEYVKDGEVVDRLSCCSGAPGRQIFRTGEESWAGSMEPLPEGQWSVNDIEWASGIDNFEGNIFQSGIGPVTVPVSYVGPGTTGRSAIEIHIDWNYRYSPGTAGCIGMYWIDHMKQLIEWLRDTDPRDLYVDWGLGTCPVSLE